MWSDSGRGRGGGLATARSGDRSQRAQSPGHQRSARAPGAAQSLASAQHEGTGSRGFQKPWGGRRSCQNQRHRREGDGTVKSHLSKRLLGHTACWAELAA